jgi:serine protease inhibitor
MRILLVGLLMLFTWLPGSAQTVGDSVAEFGFDYFQRTATEGNTVVSPLSIHAAFSMLTLGAAGETESQTLDVLRLKADFPSKYEVLLKSLQPREGRFSLASKVWPNNGFRLKKEFLRLCALTFDAAPETLDFRKVEAARTTINSWVEKRTDGLIPELLPPNGIDSGTELVLSNALYFEASWTNGFRENATRPGTFHTPEGQVEAPMMHGRVEGLHYETKDLVVVSLPYKSCPVAMMIVMPNSSLLKARKILNKELLSTVEMSSLKGDSTKMNLSLPKFTVSEASKPLPILKAMGMTKMLDSSPDLGNLAENSNGLKIDDCFHQARIEVDENGTRAAAATAITITRSAPTDVKRIDIDRPFFFVLYHRSTLAPLFIGQVVDPTK